MNDEMVDVVIALDDGKVVGAVYSKNYKGFKEAWPHGFENCPPDNIGILKLEADEARRVVAAYHPYDGSRCPVCGSEAISASCLTLYNTTEAYRPHSCEDCGFSWQEVFKLVGIDNFE